MHTSRITEIPHSSRAESWEALYLSELKMNDNFLRHNSSVLRTNLMDGATNEHIHVSMH